MDAYSKYCHKIKAKNQFRELSLPTNNEGICDFTHNDYLGLSREPRVLAGALTVAQQQGVGASASRLIKDLDGVQSLEHHLAKIKNKHNALVFPSGLQANVSTLGAILSKSVQNASPLVFSDRLNHASMHLGCQLAGVKQYRYRHLDYQHLVELLNKYAGNQPKFILTESLFSMDGDIADIQQLVKIAKQFNAFLYIDEAHAFGLYGQQGMGLTEGYEQDIDIIMTSFSKAVGCAGGGILTSKALTQFLCNAAKGFIYSTGISPLIVGAVISAMKLMPELASRRADLLSKAHELRTELVRLGFNIGNSASQIIPLLFKTESEVLAIQTQLRKQNVYVSAIRPPTVPPNQCRLRLSLSSLHRPQDIAVLLHYLKKL